MKGEDMGFKGATTTGRLQEILMPLSWEVTKPRHGKDGFVFRGSVLLNRKTELLPTVANVAIVAFSGFLLLFVYLFCFCEGERRKDCLDNDFVHCSFHLGLGLVSIRI